MPRGGRREKRSTFSFFIIYICARDVFLPCTQMIDWSLKAELGQLGYRWVTKAGTSMGYRWGADVPLLGQGVL